MQKWYSFGTPNMYHNNIFVVTQEQCFAISKQKATVQSDSGF